MKLCKDCKHYEAPMTKYANDYCTRKVVEITDLVTGEVQTTGYIRPDRKKPEPLYYRVLMAIINLDPRLVKDKSCGIEGKFYEAV